ncbi:ABC transporter ATP-binding protein [Companilactobacillus mishanensis]|uniref:ABC transporter ATP-binding protein n=1 Tax=Companilactobacillus mishanensis TaxID=2486008 RepID=UPI000F78A3FB|nr:ABC transporter ATP-binding protein [Companilactobacillus mishanensis]
MTQTEVIKVDHISKHFREQLALKDLSFSIKQGEIFGFLGPSGAGKTTTIKILTGQLEQTSGDAMVLGRSVNKINESIYEQIGIVTHNSGIYEKLSVYSNLEIFASILNIDKKRINEILKRVGLYKDRKKKAKKLSQGMRQRLVLARAILHEPKVLFLDEPTSGLDPSTSMQIHKLLIELKNKGTAIFLTTHNMEEAAKLCDNLALLNDGKIVEAGSPKDICLRYDKNKRYKVLLRNNEEMILPQSIETAEKIDQWMGQNDLLTIHSCEPTLEEVFLEVTGRELV